MGGVSVSEQVETVVLQIRERAESLYRTRQLLCTEAVLVAMNRSLGGGLTEAQAVGLASGLTVGLGESGCLCGALSGAVLALGLLLGGAKPYKQRKEVRTAAKELHDAFTSKFKSSCCRILTRKVKGNDKAHFDQCAQLTGEAAEMAARLVLSRRPELLASAETEYLSRKDSPAFGLIRSLVRRL
ncbi:MAG: C_GCAxxG_C_C family protein [Deltaproteobacteria bacterium]|nr:C_GCAxxG_C_C family protein [Deltaproteobacteria bacterium]